MTGEVAESTTYTPSSYKLTIASRHTMPFTVLLPAIQQEVDDNQRLKAKKPEKTVENMFIMSIIKQQKITGFFK